MSIASRWAKLIATKPAMFKVGELQVTVSNTGACEIYIRNQGYGGAAVSITPAEALALARHLRYTFEEHGEES